MITKHTDLRLYVDEFLSNKEKEKLKAKVRNKYQPKKISIIERVVENHKTNLQCQLENAQLIKGVYDKYLSNKDYDEERFKQIDNEVSAYIPRQEIKAKQTYKVTYLRGKNILSFGDFQFEPFGFDGISVIYSDPQNYGGKSNFYKLFQILLWGQYKKLNSTSTIQEIPNKYLSQNAFIEGMLSLNEKVYFIRRNYQKKRTKYNHEFFLFELCDEKDADCFVHITENDFEIFKKENYNPSMEGYFAKNLNTKNTSNLKTTFVDKIGTLSEYIQACYFDQSNVYSLLQNKPTERTREFYNLFGGELFEQKKDAAKKLYKEFKKKSTAFQYNIEELKIDIRQKELKKQSLSSQLEVIKKEIDTLEAELATNESEKEKLIYSLHKIENYNINSLEISLKQLEQKLLSTEKQIKSLKKKLVYSYTENDYNGFIQKKKMLEEQFYGIEVDKTLWSQKVQLEKKLTENEEIIKIKTRLSEISEEKSQIKAEYNLLNTNLKSLNEKQADLVSQKCPHCGKDVNNIDELKKHWQRAEKQIAQSKKELKDKSLKIVAEEDSLDDHLNELIKIIKNDIKTLEADIEADVLFKKKQIRSQINDIEKHIQNFNNNQRTESEIQNLESQKSMFNNKILDQKEKVRIAEQNKKKIRENESIKKNIDLINIKINEQQKIKKELYGKYNVLSSDISRTEEQIKQKKDIYSSLNEDIQMDAAYNFYIATHDKDGIIKGIIQDQLNEINSQLKQLLTSLPFNIEIRQMKGVIEYFRIDKKTLIELPLENCSDFEKFISIASLHLMKLKYSTAKLSNIMHFDEIFAQTGEDNIPILYSVLEQYKEIFEHVFIISHNPYIKKMGDNLIKISKDLTKNISKIESY